MAVSVRERLRRHVNALEGFGLPVGSLRYVLARYRWVSSASGDQVFYKLNWLQLSHRTLQDLDQINPLGKKVAGGVGLAAAYEEFAHAYFDLKLEDKDSTVVALIGAAEKYYQDAPMSDGSKCSNPNRVAHEAAGGYVGDHACNYWLAYTSLARYTVSSLSRLKAERMEWYLRRTQEDYDNRMGASVFGYEDRGLLSLKQVHTRKAIFPRLREYCDTVVLEKKLPASFQRNTRLVALLAHVRKRMVAAGLSPPGAPARSSPLRQGANRR